MKKKCLIAVAVAGMMMAGQMTAYASSINSGIFEVYGPASDDDSSSNVTTSGGSSTGSASSYVNAGPGAVNAANANGTVTINEANVPLASGPLAAALGFHTTAAATSAGANGQSVSVVVDAQTTVTDKGEVVSNGMALSFVNGDAATAGLPSHVVDVINKINAGQPLNTTLNSPALAGYNALTGTHALVAKDPASSAVKTGSADVRLYVPNLVDGLTNVAVLYYDNVTGLWKILPAVVDPASKIVTVNVTGSGTLTVIYK